MKSEFDRRWSKADKQAVQSSKTQRGFQRFKELKEELSKPVQQQRKEQVK